MKKHNKTIYPLHELQRQGLKSHFNAMAANLRLQLNMLEAGEAIGFAPPHPYTEKVKKLMAAAVEMSDRFSRDYTKPAFGLTETGTGGAKISVTEEVITDKDFGALLHFKRDTTRNDPKVLIVAPMSGHHASLLRDTVARLLPDHDVYITDWKDARTVPLSKGDFSLDDYITYVQDFVETVGPNTHVIAFSQSTVPTLATIALLAGEGSNCQPLSMTLIGGPIDTRAAATQVTRLTTGKTANWFAENMIAEVPQKYPGAGRLVYPGFLQLFSFMSIDPDRHMQSHLDLFKHLADGDDAKADKIKAFYDEYLSVCDMPGTFYMDTVQKVFIDQELAKGTMSYKGQKVDLAAITKTALLTVEGGKDNLVAPGQTVAAHSLCSSLQDSQRFHYLHPDADHFGLVSGHLWRDGVSPQVMQFIRKIAAQNGLQHDLLDSTPAVKLDTPPKFKP
jgi:poly(3-hydroxybutyrate) depolymerase